VEHPKSGSFVGKGVVAADEEITKGYYLNEVKFGIFEQIAPLRLETFTSHGRCRWYHTENAPISGRTYFIRMKPSLKLRELAAHASLRTKTMATNFSTRSFSVRKRRVCSIMCTVWVWRLSKLAGCLSATSLSLDPTEMDLYVLETVILTGSHRHGNQRIVATSTTAK